MGKIDLDDIRKLSVDDRLELIGDIWETLDDADGLDLLTDEQRQMLDERFEAHRRAPETSIPWEEVRARLFALE
jgi:putative addiction module component (TIGR02574 family)